MSIFKKLFGREKEIKVLNIVIKDEFPEYDDILINNPATIIRWKDGTKTVVKCQKGETFDPEKGIALCYMKKAMGNTGRFNEVFKKTIKEFYGNETENGNKDA